MAPYGYLKTAGPCDHDQAGARVELYAQGGSQVVDEGDVRSDLPSRYREYGDGHLHNVWAWQTGHS